ncbi:MAG: hypothetical protein AAB628_03050 [Patescibacteria group bacterium]
MADIKLVHSSPDRDLFKFPQGQAFYTNDVIVVSLKKEIIVDYDTLDFDALLQKSRYTPIASSIKEKNYQACFFGAEKFFPKIVLFPNGITARDAEVSLSRMGLRACTTIEQLAFGKAYPLVRKYFCIVALGSPIKVNGVECVSVVSFESKSLCISLVKKNVPWQPGTAFLVTSGAT